MKKMGLGKRGMGALLIASALSAATAHATPILYEGFAYTVGQNLENQINNSVQGGPQDWDRAGSAATNTPIVAGTLTNPYLLGDPATGEKVTVGPFTTRADRLNFPGTTTGTIYYSMLLNVSDLTAQNTGSGASATGAFLFGFNNSTVEAGTNTVPTVMGARLQIRRDPSEAAVTGGGATKYNITVFNSGSPVAGDFNDPTAYLINQTYFIVASYTFNTGSTTDDVANVWINPDPATFDPNVTVPNDSATGGDITTGGVQTVLVRNTGGLPTTSAIDEIFVSMNYQDVVPEPASVSLLGLVALRGLARRRR